VRDIFDMYWLNLQELVASTAIIAAAVLLGRLLYVTARRNPDSILVKTGMLADMLCVVEVIFVVLGPMVLFHFMIKAV